MKNLILAAIAALSMQLAVSAGISDTVGGRTLTEAQKTTLLAYQGRSPLVKLEQAVLVVKLDIEAGRYQLNSHLNYVGGTIGNAVSDADNLLAYFYSPAFKVLTPKDVAFTQHMVDVMRNLHNFGPQ